MPDITITDLNETYTSNNTDVLLVENASATMKITKSNLLKEINNALENKSNLDHIHSDYATKSYVDSQISNLQLDGNSINLDNYVTKVEANEKFSKKADTNHTHEEYATIEYVDSILSNSNTTESNIFVFLDDFIDGNTCDSAFLNAKNYILNNSTNGSGTIILSSKIYLHDEIINLDNDISITCINGMATLKSTNTSNICLKIGNNAKIENINFQLDEALNKTESNNSSQIFIENSNNVKIKNCNFINCVSYGILLHNVSNFLIENCNFENVLNDAIQITKACESGIIEKNNFSNIKSASIRCISYSTDSSETKNIKIINNNINTSDKGIMINGGNIITISNNVLQNLTRSAIGVEYESNNSYSTYVPKNIIIDSNTIKNWCLGSQFYSAIDILRAQDSIIIKNNTILGTITTVYLNLRYAFFIDSPQVSLLMINNYISEEQSSSAFFRITNNREPNFTYNRGVIIEGNSFNSPIDNTNFQLIENVNGLVFRNNIFMNLNNNSEVDFVLNNIRYAIVDGNKLTKVNNSTGVIRCDNVTDSYTDGWNYCKMI